MILSDLDIVDEWHTLVPDLCGEGPGILAAVEDNLAAVGVPGLRWTHERVATNLLASVLNRGRPFLVAVPDLSPNHRILVGVRDHGTALGVSFLVVCVPSPWRRLQQAFMPKETTARRSHAASPLDAFAVSDLAAAIAVVRNALDRAVRSLAESFSSSSDPWGHPKDVGDPGFED